MSSKSFYISVNRDGVSPSVGELHINMIRYSTGCCRKYAKSDVCIDMGISLKLTGKEINILLYVPFAIEWSQGNCGISDLGNILSKDRALASSLFNEDLSVKEIPQAPAFYQLEKQTDGYSIPFKILYVLNRTNFEKIELDPSDKGTLVKIKIPIIDLNSLRGLADNSTKRPENDAGNGSNPVSEDMVYIRFRIKTDGKHDGVKSLITSERLNNDVIRGVFEKTDLFDIRVNDKRLVSDKEMEALSYGGTHQLLMFEKVHFFYITDVRERIHGGLLPLKDTRILEPETWCDYLKALNDRSRKIAYHWKSKKEEKEVYDKYCNFFKGDNHSIHVGLLLLYFLIVIALGTIGSVLGSCVCKLL